ncbi:MAG: ATP-dependent helicase [Vicinamibacteria bacterium]
MPTVRVRRLREASASPAEPQSAKAGLNPAQEKAAEILEGPLLVIAGAGTGKTHTLVHRLVRLVESGVPAESILLLTFTRRAAEEMIGRAAEILGRREPVSGGTFHSFANLVLRRHGKAIDLPSSFTILDQSDVFEILSGIRADLKATAVERRLPRRETIAAILSKAVNSEAAIEDVVSEEFSQFFEHIAHLEIAATRYASYKKERNFVDFDDLLVLLIRLLEESPETASLVRASYRYLMVDEYQDTNLLQARITHLLAGEARNVMVVGDDAQSIYAFRGACHENLFEFHRSFDDARVVTLEENYRSTQGILDVANGLMSQMSEAFRKRLFTARGEGAKPRLVEASDEFEQARFVAAEVIRLRGEGVPLSESAVLFRASRHAFALEVELAHLGIPYVKYGGFRFMESAHIKDVLAHLRLLVFPGDDLALSRVLTMREGIGKTGARNLQQFLVGKPLVSGLRSYRAKGKVRSSLDELATIFEALEREKSKPSLCLEAAIQASKSLLQTRYDDWPRRMRDLETLVSLCGRYRSLSSMLSDLTLEPPTASRRERLAAPSEKADELVLSTVHSAKGLEWRAVFVIQARDGYIPMVSAFGEDPEEESLDEELRLLYVAITRARDFLTLVWPRDTARSAYDWPMPSRFLTALPEERFEHLRAHDVVD